MASFSPRIKAPDAPPPPKDSLATKAARLRSISSRLKMASPTKFRPLREGALIRIVQPAYKLDPKMGVEFQKMLSSLGFSVNAASVGEGFGRLSDDDANRAAEIDAAFADPAVGAIIVGHGGYGSMRLLDRLDWGRIARNPKPVIGFSDATALLAPLASAIGANTVHGPNVRSLVRDEDETTLAALAAVLRGDWGRYNWLLSSQVSKINPLRRGRARGPLMGGNLSLLAALCGTPFGIDTRGAILFIEEWNEPHYRVDRMLTQLELAGVFSGLAGLVLGQFLDIRRTGEDLRERIESRVVGLVPTGIPIVSQFPAGHGPTNFPLLQSATYCLDGASLELVA